MAFSCLLFLPTTAKQHKQRLLFGGRILPVCGRNRTVLRRFTGLHCAEHREQAHLQRAVLGRIQLALPDGRLCVVCTLAGVGGRVLVFEFVYGQLRRCFSYAKLFEQLEIVCSVRAAGQAVQKEAQSEGVRRDRDGGQPGGGHFKVQRTVA